MESDFRRGHRDSELVGDLFVRQAVHVFEHDEHAQLGGQLLERPGELRQQRLRLCRFLGLGVGMQLDHVVDGVERFGAIALPTLHGAVRGIRGDPVHPRGELRVAAEAVQALPGSEICLLHHVACVLLVGREAQCERVGVDVGAAHQFVERRPIPTLGGEDQPVQLGELPRQFVGRHLRLISPPWGYS